VFVYFCLGNGDWKGESEGREHTGAADPCNAAMGKIKERETIHRLATELHLELGSLQVEKTDLSKGKGDACFQIKHKNYHEGWERLSEGLLLHGNSTPIMVYGLGQKED